MRRSLARRHPGMPAAPASLRRRAAGFTLIELTVLLLIIGILSSLALYSYKGLVARARMTQAKTVLAHLARTEAIFYADNDRYTDDVAVLDFDPVRYPYYHVSVVLDNDAKNFTGIATGVGPMAGDRWTVTRTGDPVQDNASTFR